jgi:hypothetical protein
MSLEAMGAGALDYSPCRYGKSKLLFRGPARRLDAPYVAFIGGTETYGKFINSPFPALVESTLGVNCVNLGISNAGVDVFMHDDFLVEAARNAVATVVQVVGAQNLTNRFYSVHPRRNDRFLTASPVLKSIYPEVDFSEFHFNRHMLNRLYAVSAERFVAIRAELQKSWVARVQLLLSRIGGKVVLVWFSENAPASGAVGGGDPAVSRDPLFVTREMLDILRPGAVEIVEVAASPQAIRARTKGMVFSEMESLAAQEMMGPKAHGELARVLAKALQRLV